MGRIIVKLLTQAILLVGPIITLNWSILSFLGFVSDPVDINLRLFHITGPKSEVEFNLRLVATAFGFLLFSGSEIFEYYIPKRDFKEFRSLYLNHDAQPRWRTSLIPDIRINIMHARRVWYFLWLIRVFHWTWSNKFDPPDHVDANLKLIEFQGVCGEAFRTQESQLVDFRTISGQALLWYEKWLLMNQFHLWPSQLSKISHVKGILSIPILKEIKGNSPRWRPVGVINLDTTTDEGVEFLKVNKQKLVDYFTDYGKILACLK